VRAGKKVKEKEYMFFILFYHEKKENGARNHQISGDVPARTQALKMTENAIRPDPFLSVEKRGKKDKGRWGAQRKGSVIRAEQKKGERNLCQQKKSLSKNLRICWVLFVRQNGGRKGERELPEPMPRLNQGKKKKGGRGPHVHGNTRRHCHGPSAKGGHYQKNASAYPIDGGLRKGGGRSEVADLRLTDKRKGSGFCEKLQKRWEEKKRA